MEFKPYFNCFSQKSNSILKTTIIKKPPNFIVWSSKNPDDFFENSFCQINESKTFKSNEKENISNNEGRTNLSSNSEENKLKQDNTPKKNEEEKPELTVLEIEIKKEEESQSEQKEEKFGRKKDNSNKTGKHTKYSDDNLIRKCKHLILESIMKFINKKLKEIYVDIGQGMLIKKLFVLNHEQKSNAIVQYNKDLLNKTLKEIFSNNISTRYTNFPENHNKRLIEKLINEQDEEKRIYFTNLFNLKLIQGLNHFIGEEEIEELNGIETINKVLGDYDNEPDYKDCLRFYLTNFTNIINRKKSRKKRDKKK